MAAAQPNRLPDGGRIDRSRPLAFTFDGRAFEGFAGDTLASALMAGGVSLVGRSFKLRRPRGIVGSGAEEPNAIMQIGEGAEAQPNLPATQVELREGLSARSTRGWPNVRFDIGAVNDAFGRVLGAGFYYKTFMWPRSWWKHYEHAIRKSAGFGQAPEGPDPDRYEHMNAHCDVLVAGGGPAGLMAALTAAKSGARVILADEQNEFGGSLLASPARIGEASAAEWAAATVAELRNREDCILLPSSTVFGYHDHNFLTIAERCAGHSDCSGRGEVRERLWRVRARQVVLAQGSLERPLVFCNNDRPGVMLASAVSAYIHRYAVLPGRRAVVFTNNDSAYRAAICLAGAGAEVAAIVDSRPGGAGELGAQAHALGIPVLAGHVVSDVSGRRRVTGAGVARWNGDSREIVRSTIRISCDLVVMSGGWSPAVHLHSQAGGRLFWDDSRLCFLPLEGASRQCFGWRGQWQVVAGRMPGGRAARRRPSRVETGAENGGHAGAGCLRRCRGEPDRTLVADAGSQKRRPLSQAIHRLPERHHRGRYSPRRARGLPQRGACQAIHGARLRHRPGQARQHQRHGGARGHPRQDDSRGGDDHVSAGLHAGGASASAPAKAWANSTIRFAGPRFTSGMRRLARPWRPSANGIGRGHFPQKGEDLPAAVARECLAVRNSLGVMDASTLGKIDACGPDVVEFLERIYTHNVGGMQVGRCAYGVILGEDGMLMDDGVMARTGERRFYLTTTTGGAAAVLDWMEKWLQTEWPELEVYLTSLTDHYSTIAVAGPNSRSLLEKLDCDVPLDKDSFPFMAMKPAVLAGMGVTLFRVSFSGELAFEINIDSNNAHAMWRRIMEAGAKFDITPYGTETMHVLRAEKGFFIAGQDTDGSVTPVDLGMNWLLSKDKDFLGKRSLQRPDCLRDDRKQWVGLLSQDGRTVLPEGTQLIGDTGKPAAMCGHVTSSYNSACLGHPIALALVAGGRGRKDETIYAALPAREPLPVQIVSPIFYDPRGKRQHV